MNSGFGGPDPYGYEGDRSSGRYPAQPPVSSQNGNGNYNKLRSRSFDENPNAPPKSVPQLFAQYSSYQNPGGPLNPPLNHPVHQPTYLGSASYTTNMPPSQLPGGGPPPPMPLSGQSAGFSGSAPSVAHLNQPLQPDCGQPPPGPQFGPAGAANTAPFGLTQQGDPIFGEPRCSSWLEARVRCRSSSASARCRATGPGRLWPARSGSRRRARSRPRCSSTRPRSPTCMGTARLLYEYIIVKTCIEN